MLSQLPLPLLPPGAAEIAPGVGLLDRRGRRAGRGARAGHLRLGCRGRGGPQAGRGAAGPAAGRLAGPGGGGVRGGPGHHLAVGPGGWPRAGWPGWSRPVAGRGARSRAAAPALAARIAARCTPAGGRCRQITSSNQVLNGHRPQYAAPGPAGRPGRGGQRAWCRQDSGPDQGDARDRLPLRAAAPGPSCRFR